MTTVEIKYRIKMFIEEGYEQQHFDLYIEKKTLSSISLFLELFQVTRAYDSSL